MHSLGLSVTWIRAACVVMLLGPSAAHTAWGQPETVPAAQALTNWLECEYCEHDELAGVKQYGQAIVPNLIQALNHGLSPPSRDELSRVLEKRYAQLVEQSNKNRHAPIGVTKEKFVELYLDISDAQYRVRAAQALAAIGGEEARAALEAAANQSPREDVREFLRKLPR